MSLQLFGILNYTPDSFFDGGKRFDVNLALQTAQKLLDDGSEFIDVGAEATNPFVRPIDHEEEIKRLTPILPKLLERFPNQISLDTYHPETLAWALKYGKPIINDVSGFYDPRMTELAAKHHLTCIVGHLPREAEGVPTKAHKIKIDDLQLVVRQMLERAEQLLQSGIDKQQLILDPNIGFGKSMKLNWQLLEFAKYVPGYKVMIGHSNKRFLGTDPATGNLLENGQELRFTSKQNKKAAEIAIESGAAFLRIHNPEIYRALI